MREQQRFWQHEHREVSALPSVTSNKPAEGVKSFVAILAQLNTNPPKKVIDIGCGKGRNAAYLARLGFEAYGMDYIEEAVQYANRQTCRKHSGQRIHLCVAAIDYPWPFLDNVFDLAVDYYSSIDIETLEGRAIYKAELMRTLKPGGYGLIAAPSVNDKWEQELLFSSPGSERNTTMWPGVGKFQKVYDEEELRDFYSDFKILSLREFTKRAVKLNKTYLATNFWMIIQKL